MKKSTIAIAAVAGVLAVMSAPKSAEAGKNEKCYGVSKAGKNDCATSTTSCAGSAKADNQKDAWIYVPKGTCDKIVGSSKKPA